MIDATRLDSPFDEARNLLTKNQVLCSRLAVSDSVPAFRLDQRIVAERLSVISIAPLLAQAIARFSWNESSAAISR